MYLSSRERANCTTFAQAFQLVGFEVFGRKSRRLFHLQSLHLLGEACGMTPSQVAYFVARCESMQKTFAELSAPL